MKKTLFILLVILPIVVHAKNYKEYLFEMNDMCPFEYSIGKMVSVNDEDRTVIVTFQVDNQTINAITKIDSQKKYQELLREYLTFSFLEFFEGYPDFFSSFSLGVSKMIFRFENSKSKVIHEVTASNNHFLSLCIKAADDGTIQSEKYAKTNLRFSTLFENTLGPYEPVPGYIRSKVEYDEVNNRLNYICVLDEQKAGGKLPKSCTDEEKETIKEMWFGSNGSFMDIVYPTIHYLEIIKGSFAVIIQGSISKNQIIIDMPYHQLKAYAISYRLNLMK